MRRIVLAVGLLVVALAPLRAAQLDLQQAMADPDWMGPAVERPYWSADSQSIYYRLKQKGSPLRDLYRVDVVGATSTKLTDAELSGADAAPILNHGRDKAAFVRHGDVFVRDLANGALQQITRTEDKESAVQWSADDSALQYKVAQRWYEYDFANGTISSVATIKAEDNPHDEQPGQLDRKQLRLFESLRQARADREALRSRELQQKMADATRSGPTFWLGSSVDIVDTQLSPAGRYMLVVTQAAGYKDGKHPVVNHYVTESGYGKPEKTRIYVGHDSPAPQALWLLDLEAHAQHELSLDPLPGVHEDPLAKLRAKRQAELEEAGHNDEAEALNAPETRPVRIADYGPAALDWSDDGSAVAVMFRAIDNKDRWIASVDFRQHKLVPQHRLHDKAWINWGFNDFGFVPGSHSIWYLSEQSGYSHLYVKPLQGRARQLTKGTFEVSQPQFSADGQWVYLRANQQAPVFHDLYRLPVAGGDLQRLTQFKAIDGYRLSPDGKRIAVLHSKPYLRPQLSVLRADGSESRQLTDTRTTAYKAMRWIQPEFVQVPSSHGDFKIYAKLYKAPDFDPSTPHPAVLFVHGAGYLQDANYGWSHYFREQMFNNMLAHEGYVVLAMDYRASEGYGRDWRTAIYRNMGHPELEDLLDGKAWLVENFNVDPARVGIYGGSYGGFMTFMALLRAPGEFAAGAAVRPVADWSSYNHEYTSNILNTPQLDPEAYRVSSPIEFAENLADPLLICHGLIDNNVLPDGSIRLYQRFIELRKEDFWMSLYPMERHGFHFADSWYDEYRRIHELFTRYVKNGGDN